MMVPIFCAKLTKYMYLSGGSRALTVKKHAPAYLKKDRRPVSRTSLTISMATDSLEAGTTSFQKFLIKMEMESSTQRKERRPTMQSET